ncbi:tape measure protein [Methylomonas rapida]|uniref:Tape measure protein n=1 Tax=Methylomonas rapida TaxID=2963939 RepID=A0ABY7GK44_9GAMM|nr:tape measure protein [Methylomonas rapida]WAR43738.1 tape measure protein [Methylomonas rapida]
MSDMNLKIRIQGESKSAEDSVNRINSALLGLESSSNKLNGMLAKLGVGLSIAGVADAVFDATRKFDGINKTLEVTSGSAEKAAQAMDFIRNTSQRLGTDMAVSAKAFSDLQAAANGTAMEGENTRTIFAAVSQAMAALGKSSAETEGALLAIGQMMSKGTVSAEELRGQLGERLPGAFNLMAQALDVSTAELSKLLEQGKVGIDVLPRFAKELDKAYSGAKFDGIESSLTRIGNAWDRLLSASGQAIKLDVVLKTFADIVTPEASNRYTDLVERRNQLNSMIGRRENFGVEAADYKRELEGINKELDTMDRKLAAADKFNPRFGAPMKATYDEYDQIIAEGQKLAEYQSLINKGQADAQERLWTQNRKRIDEQAAASDAHIKQLKAEADALNSLYANAELNLEKQIQLHGDNSAAAEMEFEVQFGGLSKLNDAQKVRLLNLAAEKDFIEQSAARQSAMWQQLIDDANEFVDVTKAIQDFAAGDVSQSGFNGLLARINDDLNADIISAEQAKQKFDELGQAFNAGFIEPATNSTNELSEYGIQAARNMQSAFADFLFDPFDAGMDGMLEGFGNTVRRMAAEAASAQLMDALFGKTTKDGGHDWASGLLGAAFSGLTGAIGGGLNADINGLVANSNLFANGGIMTSAGALPLNKYANGGIASSPQLALFGEGSMNEAYVPLPDGRSIPVTMTGGDSGGDTYNYSVSINVQGGNNPEETGRRVAEAFIRTVVREEITTQKRPGGMLNSITRY